jgi:hypothetical protein
MEPRRWTEGGDAETVAQLVGIAFILMAAAFTQSVIGFGFGLVSMGVLPLVWGARFSIPLVAIYALALTFIIFLQHREKVKVRQMLPLIVGAVAGTPFGVLILKKVPEEVIIRGLGVMLVVYGVWSLFGITEVKRAVGGGWGYLLGFISGNLGGAFNVGGPPAIVFVTLKNWDKDELKGSLQLFLIISVITRLSFYVAAHLVTRQVLLYCLYFVPFVAVGYFAGLKAYAKLDTLMFKKVTYLGLLGLGLFILVK